MFDPRSLSFNNAMTWTRGTHTLKGGFEYRTIQSDFQFLGSTEITFNSINDFIDNRPAAVAVALDSPVFKPQQFYAIGFVQDSWSATDRLTLDLGLRYDYYSVVKEADGLRAAVLRRGQRVRAPTARPSTTPTRTTSRRGCRRPIEINDKTALRAGFGLFYGPGQFEDRIQPIENYIERRRVQMADVPEQRPAVSGARRRSSPTCCRFAATRITTRTNTTCSTASACRASCPAPST